MLYLTVSEYAINTVLTREEKGIHHIIYFTSKALHKAELRCLSLEKLAYIVVIAARKLRPYFWGHRIEVLTNCPLKQILQKPDTSGQMVKWTIELEQFNIRYGRCTSIKNQALVDFVAEFNIEPVEELMHNIP